MARKKKPSPERWFGDLDDVDGFGVWMPKFLEWLRVRNYSPRTVQNRAAYLSFLALWCAERGVTQPRQVTRPVLERYQRHLFYLRQKNGKPLTFRAQHARLIAVRVFFKWLTRRGVLPANPASELELPRLPQRLPPPVFSHKEVERILLVPDTSTPVGLRDRAIIETFYSTGVRRQELTQIHLHDLDTERLTLQIRLGKGQRDRVVPIGSRAVSWIRRYLDEARPKLIITPDDGTLFLSTQGGPLNLDWLTQKVRQYVRDSGVTKQGSCHAFRHAMATAMHEAGVDIRHIQALLGHASIESTEIYTRVGIRKLQAIHAATHPAEVSTRPEGKSAHGSLQEELTKEAEDEEPSDPEDGQEGP